MRRLLVTVLLAELLLPLTVAHADVPPLPEPPNPCVDKKVGDACNGSGTCGDSMCCPKRHVSATLLHYERQKPSHQQNPDITGPPRDCKPCLTCSVTSPPGPSTPPDTNADEPPLVDPPPAPAPATPQTPPPVAAPPVAAPPPTPAEPAKQGACTIAAQSDPGLLACIALALGFVRRRRPGAP